MKRIAVYCGASTGNDRIFENITADLGYWLVDNQYELVYGGGKFGLMGVIAESVMEHGGTVWGVIPEELRNREAAFNEVTHLKVVANMSIRKRTMLEMADGCIALPGGPGTLEEIAEAFSWAVIGDNNNPCVFYNVDHYYDPLRDMFDEMANRAFLAQESRDKLLFSDSLTEIKHFMENYEPPKIRTYHK